MRYECSVAAGMHDRGIKQQQQTHVCCLEVPYIRSLALTAPSWNQGVVTCRLRPWVGPSPCSLVVLAESRSCVGGWDLYLAVKCRPPPPPGAPMLRGSRQVLSLKDSSGGPALPLSLNSPPCSSMPSLFSFFGLTSTFHSIINTNDSVLSDSLRPPWTTQSVEFSRPEYWSGIFLLQRSSQPRDWTQVSCIAGGFFTGWATREAQEYWSG